MAAATNSNIPTRPAQQLKRNLKRKATDSPPASPAASTSGTTKHPKCRYDGCTKFARRAGEHQYCMRHQPKDQKRWCSTCKEHIAQYAGGKCTSCAGKRLSKDKQHPGANLILPFSFPNLEAHFNCDVLIAPLYNGAPIEYASDSIILDSSEQDYLIDFLVSEPPMLSNGIENCNSSPLPGHDVEPFESSQVLSSLLFDFGLARMDMAYLQQQSGVLQF